MKRFLIGIVLTLTVVLCANAQKHSYSYTVKGVVADSTTHAGEPYATLAIALADSVDKPLKQAITDANGRFSITATGAGRYQLIVRAVGRQPLQRTFTVNEKTRTIDLGILPIQDSKNELEEVQVVAYKPLVKTDVDKITYNMEDDPDAKTNSVIEMLKKVPMVTVDGQDKVQVNGSTSFKIYVNGKPNNMMTKNPTEVLKGMPASSIKKIEVITDPGAKYDAEGVGGILNIITNGNGPEGYNATFSAGASNHNVNAGVYATVKQGKLTMSVNYDCYPQFQPKFHSFEQSIITDDDGNETRRTTEIGVQKQHTLWHGGSVDLSYEIDTLRLLSGAVSLDQYHSNNNQPTSVEAIMPTTGNRLYGYTSSLTNKYNEHSINANIDYQRSFSNVKDRLLTLSYRISTAPTTNDIYTTYSDRYADDDWADFVNRFSNQHYPKKQNTVEHTFQLDYTTPFAKHHTWDVGAKYIMRRNSADVDRYNIDNSGSEIFDLENSSHYRHRNDILAAYTDYAYRMKKWTIKAGVRYEHTLQKVTYLLGRGSDFHKDFDDVVPTVRLGYQINDASNITLSYNMRIYRPSVWYLDPYLNDREVQTISQGNPNLVSEKNHRVNLQYSNYGKKLNFNVSLKYRYTGNSIESVTTLVNDRDIDGLSNPTGQDVFYSTYANIGKTQYAALELYAQYHPWKGMSITYNGQGAYAHMSDGQSLRNHGWLTSNNLHLQQKFAKTWTATLQLYASTPSITLQGKGTNYTQHSLTISKSFMDKRLNISVTTVNPFKRYKNWTETTTGDHFSTYTSDRGTSFYYGIRASWRIGKLKESVKKADRSIENDDVKSGGSK